MKKLIIALLILLVIGAYFIKTKNDLNLKESGDLQTFVKVYSKWVYNLGLNLKDISGYVTKKQWLPETNSSNNSTT